ncbi:MAG: hypothetical protein HQ592_16320 [Planctomycetes bacterium]|nr:hypothetical protein [Planctomycetota bacterium]
MDLWVCIALLVIGFVAIFLEIFVPAGGLIGLGGFMCMLVAVFYGFKHDTITGMLMLLVTIIGTPAAVLLAFKIFPHTYIGKRLILKETQKQETGYTSYTSEKYANLPGAEGTTLTTLRPSGMARINNRKYSVVTDGEMIESGTKIKVTTTEGSRIVVAKAEPTGQEAV